MTGPATGATRPVVDLAVRAMARPGQAKEMESESESVLAAEAASAAESARAEPVAGPGFAAERGR